MAGRLWIHKRRWLGRVLDPTDVTKLKIALGISDVATAVGSGDNAASMVLGENSSIALTGGFWLRRAKVMDRYRLEVVGAGAQRAMFQVLGCFVEIINYTPRVFVPVDQPQVLSAVLARGKGGGRDRRVERPGMDPARNRRRT